MFVVLRRIREYFTYMVTSPLLQNCLRPISKQNNQSKTYQCCDDDIPGYIQGVVLEAFWGNEIRPTYVEQKDLKISTHNQNPQLWSSPRTRETYCYSWAFSSRAVTTCFNDLGLSRLRFEYPTFERSNRLCHRRGQFCY